MGTFRIRPFRQHIERGASTPTLEMVGRIEGSRAIVEAVGQRVELATVEVGEDERGPYAVVSESEQPLPDGFRLVAEVELEEDSPPGGHINLRLEGRHREVAKEELRRRGIDPDSVNLLVPAERSYSVYFDCDGNINGDGSSYASDLRPPKLS